MNTLERIVGYLKTMPESKQNEVLDFIEYLKTSARRRKQKEEELEWGQFSLKSAMRGIEEEASTYGIEDIKEHF